MVGAARSGARPPCPPPMARHHLGMGHGGGWHCRGARSEPSSVSYTDRPVRICINSGQTTSR
eukprot:6119796-Alexandrium_andersonii.AAC.1